MSEDKLSQEERKKIMDKFDRVFSKKHDSYEDPNIEENTSSNNINCLIIPRNPAINDESLLDLNNRSNGEVTTADTLNYRTGIPKPEGMLSEVIFGPMNDPEARKTRMGHIDVKYDFLNPLFTSLCGKLSGLAGNGSISSREVERLLREGYNVKKIANSTTLQQVKDFVEHSYDEFLNSKTLTDRGRTSTNMDIKVFSNFYALGVDPSQTIINKIPMIPAGYRPCGVTDDGRFYNSYLNEHYRKIILNSSHLKRQSNMGLPYIALGQSRKSLEEKIYNLFYGGYYEQSENHKEYYLGLSEFFSFERFIKPRITQTTTTLSKNIEIQKSDSVNLFEIGLPKKLVQEISDGKTKNFVNEKLFLFNVDTEDFTKLQAFTIKIVDTDYIQMHPFFYDEFNVNSKVNIKLPFWSINDSQAMLYNLICTLFVSQQFNKLYNNSGNYKGR